MRPAVVTAVLLLVGVLDAVTARGHTCHPWVLCQDEYPYQPCGGGWSRIDANRCIKYFLVPKTFSNAKARCSKLNADLVSIHNENEMTNLICMIWRNDYERKIIWIGAERSGGEFRYTDRSEFGYTRWHHGEQNNSGENKNCVESNIDEWGMWRDVNCSEKRNFVCVKNM